MPKVCTARALWQERPPSELLVTESAQKHWNPRISDPNSGGAGVHSPRRPLVLRLRRCVPRGRRSARDTRWMPLPVGCPSPARRLVTKSPGLWQVTCHFVVLYSATLAEKKKGGNETRSDTTEGGNAALPHMTWSSKAEARRGGGAGGRAAQTRNCRRTPRMRLYSVWLAAGRVAGTCCAARHVAPAAPPHLRSAGGGGGGHAVLEG